ncbi:MAG: VOC family protein [Vampirovibrio sp.]|nr:VOC family protein [Vampirovibrio sp.]
MPILSNIVPTLKYQDAPNAIEWLCTTFGFQKHLVIPGENNTITHAQLTFGNGMIMVGSVNKDEYGSLIKQPIDAGGNTQSAYIIVEEIDAHYAHAKANGADIVLDLAEQHYGGKLYSCKDPEGHLWNFGSYNPWVASS